MGTRSRIGIVNGDATITSIYCHWDGYPECVGHKLINNYQTTDRVRDLVALGDLSSLGDKIGEKIDFENCGARSDQCVAYLRDRGEHTPALTHGANDWPDYGQEYEYLFIDGRWSHRRTSERGPWKPLEG